ncbi:unnamed protein product [Prorocentrum cordatum]|uniref:Uncharacterized protein n=1 Tax=Prorocentrum cordatum TaxID=2364126 RepID=A0ABN9TUD5_9DINO|nr:unnamed protein product [Polarella glacialis]
MHWAQSTFESDGWRSVPPETSGMRNTRICGKACCLATFAWIFADRRDDARSSVPQESAELGRVMDDISNPLRVILQTSQRNAALADGAHRVDQRDVVLAERPARRREDVDEDHAEALEGALEETATRPGAVGTQRAGARGHEGAGCLCAGLLQELLVELQVAVHVLRLLHRRFFFWMAPLWPPPPTKSISSPGATAANASAPGPFASS